MPIYHTLGSIPRKRHTVAMADGGRRLEELMGQDGFSEESALLYHRHSPSALTARPNATWPIPSSAANRSTML